MKLMFEKQKRLNFSSCYSDAAGRPTVGDMVRLNVGKEGLAACTVCTVSGDDHDNNPFKLKALGTSDEKSYFTEAMIQKVVQGQEISMDMYKEITDKKIATGRSLLSIFNEELPGVL